jgi:hypothetical protein
MVRQGRGGSVGPTMSGLDSQTGQRHLGHMGAGYYRLTRPRVKGEAETLERQKGRKKKGMK